MKFHFIASVEGDKGSYKLIFKALKDLGCQPVTYHILTRTMKGINKESSEESEAYVRKMIGWIRKADFIVFEVTKEEIGCGYEMMISLDKCKPCLVLYQEKRGRVPPVLRGVKNERLTIYSYKKDEILELKKTLKVALKEVKQQTEIRFTMLLSPKIVSYLKELSKKKGIPRSVYIRKLIKEDIKKKK